MNTMNAFICVWSERAYKRNTLELGVIRDFIQDSLLLRCIKTIFEASAINLKVIKRTVAMQFGFSCRRQHVHPPIRFRFRFPEPPTTEQWKTQTNGITKLLQSRSCAPATVTYRNLPLFKATEQNQHNLVGMFASILSF